MRKDINAYQGQPLRLLAQGKTPGMGQAAVAASFLILWCLLRRLQVILELASLLDQPTQLHLTLKVKVTLLRTQSHRSGLLLMLQSWT